MAATLEAIETVWTQERVERLEEFWASGMSAALVAHALGPGVTRNAVISKVHRLKLPRAPDAVVSGAAGFSPRREDRRHARRTHRDGRDREGARDLAAHGV